MKGVPIMPLETQAALEVARFLASRPTAEQIATFHPSEEVNDRFYELIDAERERPLTIDEAQELESYVAIEYLLGIVKAEAFRQLAQKAS
jgi:hypothetical protein